MKKLLSLLLMLLVLLPCAGCSGRSKPLRICIDLESVTDLYKSVELDQAIYDLEYSIKSSEGIDNYVIEVIPAWGDERDAAIDRVRTEMMSGGGPDVFITQCVGDFSNTQIGNPIFAMPEKAMELGLFLPLDEYIENAKYSEWDKFTKSVMDAGKNEEGQQLIPLTYSVPTAIYRSSDFSYTATNLTWQEMLNDDELYDTAARLGDGETIIRAFDSKLDCILGKIADYKEEKLAFSEDELYHRVTEICELTAYTNETEPYYTEGWMESSIGYKFNRNDGAGNWRLGYNNGIRDTDSLSIVPLYSDDGGCTAIVLAFAAVNRNTMRPDDAFAVIDLLCATGKQKYSPLLSDYVYRAFENASMPMHEDVMSVKSPSDASIDLTATNFAAVSAVRDQITNVQFAGSLNAELDKLVKECWTAYRNGQDYSDIVHEHFLIMQRMLSE